MRRLFPVLIAMVALSACSFTSDDGQEASGSSEDPTSSPTQTAARGPACADVWKNGATLPANYDTCFVGDDEGPQDVTRCEDGSRLVVYNNEMFARTGGEIDRPKAAPLQDLPAYSKAYAACTGE